ncbi:helix-turn-helix domain-containing protein [Paenibacillus cremeus]|uniref:Sugar diacid utilization regulator n=1 Tax=Paenibacillus cremeus TaxID=2163881 RepID=A0A559K9N3_9BACL|nr:helix-turn-helix domain-containing protein [Paenibacillus cremeus]TVY08834.1 hypothetical protein FPZ49_16285 [Paenibacillus cremeus]
MILTSELVAPILKQLSSIFESVINVTDPNGNILASTDPQKINTVLPEALEAQKAGAEKVLQLAHTNSVHIILPIELYHRVVGALSIEYHGELDIVLPVARVIRVNLQLSLEQYHMQQKQQYQKKAEEAWLFDLINPNRFNSAELEAFAETIQIKCTVKRSILLVHIRELTMIKDAEQLSEKKSKLMSSISSILPSQGLATFCGDSRLLLCLPLLGDAGVSEKAFADKLKLLFEKSDYHVCIGIGERLEGVEGYRDSYFQALQCISLHQKLLQGIGISHINDWGLVRLMDSIPNKIRQKFADHYDTFLMKLSAEQEETLEAFLESDLSVKEAADRLHLHRNTLLYRLDKLAEQMKLDPKKFNDAIIYKLLLICKSLNK